MKLIYTKALWVRVHSQNCRVFCILKKFLGLIVSIAQCMCPHKKIRIFSNLFVVIKSEVLIKEEHCLQYSRLNTSEIDDGNELILNGTVGLVDLVFLFHSLYESLIQILELTASAAIVFCVVKPRLHNYRGGWGGSNCTNNNKVSIIIEIGIFIVFIVKEIGHIINESIMERDWNIM